MNGFIKMYFITVMITNIKLRIIICKKDFLEWYLKIPTMLGRNN